MDSLSPQLSRAILLLYLKYLPAILFFRWKDNLKSLFN